MPNVTIYRRTANTVAGVQFGVGTPNQAHLLTLFPNQYRKTAVIDADEASAFLTTLKAMQASGTIGWQMDSHDLDPEDVKVMFGLDVSDGDSANTATDYYANISAGRARLGSHSLHYPGGVDLDILALGLKKDGASKDTELLATLNSIKCRWYAVRQYNDATDDESMVLIPVFGDEDLTATVGAVTDTTTGYPSDAEVDAAFEAATLRLISSRVYISWVEIGRQLLSRAGAAITTSFVDLKDSDPNANKGFKTLTYEIDHSSFPAAAVHTVEFGDIEHGHLLAGGLRVLEASDLVALTVELGVTGQTEEIFDTIDIGTGAAPAVGPKATLRRAGAPKVAGDTLVGYRPLISLATGGPDLDTATTGKILVTLTYYPIQEVADAGVSEAFTGENNL